MVALPASAETVDIDALLLFSKTKTIHIAKASFLEGAIAAKDNITLAKETHSTDVYSEKNITYGKNVVARGRVLANKTISIGKNFDYQGQAVTGKDVSVGRDASVQGDIEARRDIDVGRRGVYSGSLLADRDIEIGNRVTVFGDASPGLKGDLTLGQDVTITGSTLPSAKTFGSFELPTMPPKPSKPKFGKDDLYRPAESTTTLDPGAYRDISIERDSVLNLRSGTYTFKSFWMDKRGTVNIDTSDGDVVINVHNGFETGAYIRFNPTGQGRVVVNVFGGNGVYLGKGNMMQANLYVWNSHFATGRELDFSGTIWAHKHISIGDTSTLTYASGYAGYPIPEPLTASLLLAGTGLMLRRRRRPSSLRLSR